MKPMSRRPGHAVAGACVALTTLSLVTLSCATSGGGAGADAAAPVQRAAKALGGVERMRQLTTVAIKGSVRHWEPEQSVKAGGDMRLSADSAFTQLRDLKGGATRIEWVRKMVYPAPREYRFSEILTANGGWVEGVDSTAMPKETTQTTPPRHAMSGLRAAALRRELLRTSPALLAEMLENPTRISRAEPLSAGGKQLQAVRYQAMPDVSFTVAFDEAGVPARIRTLDADAIHGDSTYDLVLSDWREVAGVKHAFRQSYELNGREVARIELQEVAPGAPIDPAALRPVNGIVLASMPPGPVPYQWVLRRQFYGVHLDSDAVNYDKANPGLKLVDVARGVSQVVGGTHNSLVVELKDSLVVVDAPINEWQSRWTLDAAKARYGGKPVKFLVLSHHHVDHIGGARTYVAEGAAVVAARENREHLARIFTAPHRIDDDALQRRPRPADIIAVGDKHVLQDGTRSVELYRVENPHVEGMLIAYVPDVRVGFVVDIWSPGRDKLGDKLNAGQAAVVAAVNKAGLKPERFAGGHGTVGDYAELASRAAP
jgi:glyoxylase-like metal-dependent hydrolase (beta-lactamase superfamily II)